MLERLLKVTAVALFLCLVVGFGIAVMQASNHPQSPHPKSYDNAKGASKNQKTTEPQPEKSTSSYLQEYSAYCAAEPQQENDKWRHDFWCEFKATDFVIAIFTVVLAVVTAGLIIVGICQTRLLRKEFVATHRPRIRVRRIVPVGELVAGERVSLTMEVVNIGDGAALAFEFGFDVYFPGQPFNAARERRPDFPPLPAGFENRLTLISRRPPLTETEVNAIESGMVEWRALGIVNYWDENRLLRATSLARVYNHSLRRFVKVGKDDPEADREFED